MRPKRVDRRLGDRVDLSRSATSHATEMASPPAALMRPARSSSACSLRAARTTFALLRRRLGGGQADAAQAPVMTMTCWSRGFSFTLMALLPVRRRPSS